MVLGGQAFDGFCLGRIRNVFVEALGSTWILSALYRKLLSNDTLAVPNSVLSDLSPAEVPQ